MKDFTINVSTKTSKVYLEEASIAVDGENIAGRVIFKFDGNNFIDGIARLEWQNGSNKYFQIMDKVDKTYVLPIKNVMTHEGKMYFQLVITQQAIGEEIPVFKSNQFYVFVEKSINAEGEAPDEYETWLDIANEKILEMSNLNITASKSGNTETIVLTDKQGVDHTTYIYDGQDGRDGADAKINGYNTVSIVAGENITIDQEGSTLTINGEAGGGTGNVDDVKVNGTSVVENRVANIDLTGKQDTLVSGTNIKTINSQSILGDGNLDVGGNVDIDNSSITTNSNDELQTVGVIDSNSGNTNKMWTGTLQQYNAIQNKDADTYYYITDDETISNLREKVEVITSSDTSYTIANLTGNKAYKLGELTALTITACDVFDEETIIYFSSGNTATVLSLPNDVVQLGDTTINANKSYIISVLNKIAAIKEY